MAFHLTRGILSKALKVLPKIETRNFASVCLKSLNGTAGIFQNSRNCGNLAVLSQKEWCGHNNNGSPQRGFHLLRQITPEVKASLFPLKNGPPLVESSRSLIQYGFKGRRKTVKAIVHRFYRLDWGAWIRPRSGRHNKLWRKGAKQRKRARTHVFCNATQSFMFDKMVARFWHRKKYYVDDPYETYHTRPTFWITHRR